ncbi:MAG: hypothetical protein HY821_03160 [Acidobacteria bacterium]|nr:hypothetical protein [Acidobacteriota bacterium]
MESLRRICSFVPLIAVVFAFPLCADTAAVTQLVSVSISPVGIVTFPAQVNLVPGGLAFSAFSGTLAFSFNARTTRLGSGSITVKANGDFAPAGAFSVAGGQLTYTCSSGGYGTPCSGTQTVSSSSQTPVLTIGANACTGGGGLCSSADPATASVMFSLPNSVSLETGTYTLQLTFTISCL